MRLASSISFALLAMLAMLAMITVACGGSDDFADSTDEFGSGNESPDSADTQTEAGSASSSSSATGSTATDGTATDGTATDGTATDSAASSTDADSSSSSGPGSDSMDAPMDGPSTHADDTTDGVVETDGGVGGECTTPCDCLQGLGCSETHVCAPVPDNAYCCEKDGCPAGVECVFSDGTFGVCA